MFLALGGAAGTLARVGLSSLVNRWHGSAWPTGTLVVNALGCLLFGTVWGLLTLRWPQLSPAWSVALLGGFCGAFTTFSTYIFDTQRIAVEGGVGSALGYLVLSNAVGLGLLWFGAVHVSRWGMAAAGSAG